MYKIIMMSGETYLVNKSEYLIIMEADKGIFVPRLEAFINKASISTAYPENKSNEIEDKKNQQTGVLHDGTQVRKHFGQWVDANNQVPDDKGNYQPLNLDSNYYPEVARDCVPTREEFEKNYRLLKPSERLQLMLKGSSPERIGGMESVGELLN